jgi:uncharacterized protein DUF6334
VTLPPFRDVVDAFGNIRQVLVDDANPALVSVLALIFEHGSMLVEAVADDDTLGFSLNVELENARQDVSGEYPWSLLVGGAPLWLWSLTNQQGYQDGFQILLRKDGADVGFQIMVLAGSLKPFLVIEQ